MPLQKNLDVLLNANEIDGYNARLGFATRVFITNSLREDRELGWIMKQLVDSGNATLQGTGLADNLALANIGGLACAYFANNGGWFLEGDIYVITKPGLAVLQIVHATELGLHKMENVQVKFTKAEDERNINEHTACSIFMGPTMGERSLATWPIYLRPQNADGKSISVCPILIEGSRAAVKLHRINGLSIQRRKDPRRLQARLNEAMLQDEDELEAMLEMDMDDEEDWDDEV